MKSVTANTAVLAATSNSVENKTQKREVSRELNKDGLRALHSNNQFARILFETGKKRPYGKELTIEAALQIVANGKIPVSNSDIVKVFRELDDTGTSRFTPGRRGHLSRLQFLYNPLEVCKYATGENVELIPNPVEAPAERKGRKKVLVQHALAIRPSYTLKLKVPVNLTQQEAKKIIEFIDNLEKVA